LPLILVEDVSYKEFEKKCERANASRFWEYRSGTVIIIELPKRDHEVTHGEFVRQFLNAFSNLQYQDRVRCTGAITCSATPKHIARGSKQADASFVPRLLPIPSQNSCDSEGTPWPTVIVEVADSQSLASIIQKTTQFWLAPNRCEDVIILKLWKWNRTYHNGIPKRRLTVRTSPQNEDGNYLPVQIIEFGTIDGENRLYNQCSAPGMCTLSISPHCIYRGCPHQNPPLPQYPFEND
ncbi:8733_t:CDS:2, partial [Funneliformis mosseae]